MELTCVSAASPHSTLTATWAFSLSCLFQKCVLQIEPHTGNSNSPTWVDDSFVCFPAEYFV